MHQKIERNDKSLTFYVRSISKFETLMRNPKNNEKHKKHRIKNHHLRIKNTTKPNKNEKKWLKNHLFFDEWKEEMRYEWVFAPIYSQKPILIAISKF